jgi:hypothetical protein
MTFYLRVKVVKPKRRGKSTLVKIRKLLRLKIKFVQCLMKKLLQPQIFKRMRSITVTLLFGKKEVEIELKVFTGNVLQNWLSFL